MNEYIINDSESFPFRKKTDNETLALKTESVFATNRQNTKKTKSNPNN